MNNSIVGIEIECLSEKNVHALTKLSLEFWQDCNYDEAFLNWKQIINSDDNYCALAKISEHYAGFIHLTIRNDYVEGSDTAKTAYLEAVYISPEYRQQKIATLLINKGEEWVRSKGFCQIASDTTYDNLGSQQLHNKLGYKEVNRIVCFIKTL
jgi:aminoglycoside 6'-N-acetyltransferase I